MKQFSILILGLFVGLFVSCKKDTYTFDGKAQKGPFVIGSNITINELNTKLKQTGNSFTASIVSDDGSFSFDNIELKSNLVLLTATGFYFSEVYGNLSNATLSLQAIVDLKNKDVVNVNVLTHVIKGRIETLVTKGKSFQEANKQAQAEFLSFLGVNESFTTDFSSLDISKKEDYNAVLLAFSIILQKYTEVINEQASLTAELTELLSQLAHDFETDGEISNTKLIDILLSNISQLNLTTIRQHIEDRYTALGMNVSIPNFEKYIGKFQEKHSKNLYTDFTYPASAPPYPETSEDVLKNLLFLDDTLYEVGAYSLAAIVPLNKTLTIKVIGAIGTDILVTPPFSGWDYVDNSSDGFTLHSQRQNALMSMLVHLQKPCSSAIIEYYENSTTTPTFTKTIRWE